VKTSTVRGNDESVKRYEYGFVTRVTSSSLPSGAGVISRNTPRIGKSPDVTALPFSDLLSTSTSTSFEVAVIVEQRFVVRVA